MQTSSSRELERIKIKRHVDRMKRARIKHGTHLICPDHYIPCKLRGDLTCKTAT